MNDETPERLVPRVVEVGEAWKQSSPTRCKHGWTSCVDCGLNVVEGDTVNPKDRVARRKVPLRLIPSTSLVPLALVLGLGARKYGPYNWRETAVKLSVYLESIERHTRAVLDGEDADPESKQHHIAHAMACCAIILDAIALDKIVDDRPPKGKFGQMVQETYLK
jgi:hypothetical protein